ncbi:hypothetical protein HDU98_006896 [Podochytrium sp. JEL0797]|nr:hypothetical protein HDU98_006896 [Podochytrium sp. JEL0797]
MKRTALFWLHLTSYSRVFRVNNVTKIVSKFENAEEKAQQAAKALRIETGSRKSVKAIVRRINSLGSKSPPPFHLNKAPEPNLTYRFPRTPKTPSPFRLKKADKPDKTYRYPTTPHTPSPAPRIIKRGNAGKKTAKNRATRVQRMWISVGRMFAKFMDSL